MASSRAQKIGLYGGTFAPVHHGHLILGRDAVEILGLDHLVFIPAAVSPHKLGSVPGATGPQRLAMLAAALAGEERLALDDRELHRTGPSYTIDTLLELRAELSADTELFYLIGEDNGAALHTWHRAEELSALVRFVVFRREAKFPSSAAFPPSSPLLPSTFYLLPSPRLPRLVDISATEIRNRVAKSQSIRYLVPEAVAGFIEAQRLYR